MKIDLLNSEEFAVFDSDDGRRIIRMLNGRTLSLLIGKCGLKYVVFYEGHRTIRVHRFLLGVTDPKVHVDHIDGNGLNNRRSNLRACSLLNNIRNQRKRTNGSSKFKGVFKYGSNGKFRSSITINYKSLHLGCFHSEREAAEAYDAAAISRFGKFARVNFKKEVSH